MPRIEKMDKLQIRLLGALHVERNGDLITDFKTDATRALLGLLALQHGVQRRDVLATRLAPEGKTDSAALKYLRLNLDRLRGALQDRTSDPPFLTISRKEIGLTDHVWVDALEFERLLDEVATHPHRGATQCPTCLATLGEAAALYRGDVLAGLNFENPMWQEWLREIRSQMQEQAIGALTTLAQWRYEQALRGQGEWPIVLEAARAVLRVEAWHEQAHRWAVEAFWQMGQVGEALAQYEACVAALDEALGIAPHEETEALRQRIARFADRTSAEIDIPHNLPEARTAFFGRSHELTQLQTLLTDPRYRLVSVVGEGGMGKSRLAQEVGWQLRPSFPDGVWFVPLAGVTTRDGIVAAVAQALDFSFRQGAPPLQQLLRFLRKAELLLILDNFEQLVGSAELLREILNAANGVVLLCTSRTMLNLEEEIVLPLRGLEIATRRRNQTLDVMQPAIQLFAARARRSDARFVLDEESAETVEQLALLLEGNPLGLELAASWARSRTVGQILKAVGDSADFLAATDGADVDRRHHTMRAVFETSWQMLSPTEQALYPKLSLFRGGFTDEAAQFVANATWNDLDLLVEKSMVQFDGGRYHVHELLRQFADAHVTNRTTIETHFVAYFASHLETNGKELARRGMKQAIRRITQEEANVKQGWKLAIEQQSPDLPAMSDYLTGFYIDVGRVNEGRELIKQALHKLGEDTPISIQLQYLNLSEDILPFSEIEQRLRKLYLLNPSAAIGRYLGRILWRSGRAAEAVAILHTSVASAIQNDEVEMACKTLHEHGIAIQLSSGDDSATLDSFSRALKMAQEQGFVSREAFLLIDLGQLYTQMRQPKKALTYYENGLALAREIDSVQDISMALILLCRCETALKHYVQAVQYATEGVTLSQQLEDDYAIHIQETEMGFTLSEQGRLTQAETCLQRAHQTAKKQENSINESFLAKLLGKVAYARTQYANALAYYEEALQKVGDDIRFKAEIHFVMGNVLLALGRVADAATQFTHAIESNHSMGKTHREMEGKSGLAEVFKQQGRLNDARNTAAQVAAFIDSGDTLFGCEDDLHIFWRLYVVLAEPRWLEQAHTLLLERAAQFGADTPEQHAYLHNLPVHRQILTTFAAASQRMSA